MADFLIAANRTIDKFERGYSNNPNDAGGRTRFGIAEKFHPEVGDAFYRGSAAEARPIALEIYRKNYWKFDGVTNQEVANKLFDECVNWGTDHGITLAQNALLGIQVSGYVDQDGKFGFGTQAAVNRADPEAFLAEYRAQVAFRHAERIVDNPSQLVFGLGWMRRACA